MKLRIVAALAAVIAILGAGCATPLPETPGTPESAINLSELENDLGGTDPIESANRVMFAVTDFCMDYIVDFIGRIYCTILPRPVIDAVDNVCVNLEFPARAVSCLLSAEWRGAGDETVRFLANSTIGIGGIFDVAGPWWGFFSTDSDFGQAFAAWGIDPGCTLTLPFAKAINVRDTVGKIFDVAFDGKTYIPFSGYITTLNRIIVAHRDYIAVVEGSSDRYKTFRELLLLHRELQMRKYVYHAKNAAYAAARSAGDAPPPEAPEPAAPKPAGVRGDWLPIPVFKGETPQEQSLRLLRFRPQRDNDFWYYPLSLFNRDFVRLGSSRRLALHPGRAKARYGFWKQPKPEKDAPPRREKLALVLPGIGGAWNTSTCVALAEVFYRAGYDVATFDSAFNWHFVVSSNPHIRMPGFLPEDAAAVRELLAAALEDLKIRGEINSPHTVLAGYSMGAMHALKIAAAERGLDRLGLDRVIAVNPPVDLRFALERADSFARRGGTWSPREAADRIVDLSGRQIMAQALILPPLGAPHAPDSVKYRFAATPDEAACAMGMYLNSSLRDVLMVTHRERPISRVATPYRTLRRNRLYLELDGISFKRYAEEILTGEYPGIPEEELFAASSLRSLENTLRSDAKIRILHSWNDPLLSDGDAQFLDRALGGRISWTSGGGHLGNLCVQEVQKRLIELAEPARERPEPAANAAPRAGADRR